MLLLAALGRARRDARGGRARSCASSRSALVNVRADRTRLAAADAVWDAVREVERDARRRSGRIVLRASGTEPLVRVMVEASEEDDCARHCAGLVAVVERELGLD